MICISVQKQGKATKLSQQSSEALTSWSSCYRTKSSFYLHTPGQGAIQLLQLI